MGWEPPNRQHPPPKAGEPPLHRAAREGDHDAIRRLAAEGADLDAVFDIGLDPGAIAHPATPLMVAAGSGDGADEATVRLLLELGAKPRIVLDSGSALSFACLGLGWNYRPGGDAARLRILIEAGTPAPTDGWAGPRLVAAVAEAGDAERLRLLIDECGLSPDALKSEKELKRQREQMVELLEGQVKWPLNKWLKKAAGDGLFGSADAPMDFEIPVFAAARAGSVACLEILESAGADLGARSWMAPNALFVASTPEVVRWLLERGVDPKATNDQGLDAFGALLEAVGEGESSHDAPRALLETGIDVERQDKWPHTRLAEAAFHRNARGVDLLLRLGVPVNPPEGRPSALHCVCWQGSSSDEELDEAGPQIIERLVASGAGANAKDEKGRTPLHEAVEGDWSYPSAVRTLLRLGADPDPVDPGGETPLMLAADAGCVESVRELLFAGADPLKADRKGRTALSRARSRLGGSKATWATKRLMRGLLTKVQLAEIAEDGRRSAEMTFALIQEAAKGR